MNSVIKDINVSASNPVILCPISDTHVGHASFDQEYFTNSVKWIKDNRAYVILLGDLIDAIPTQDRRFENTSIAKEFLPHLDNLHHEQTTSVIKMLRPIKDQIIAMLSGNHECKLRTSFSYDATKVISDALGIARISDPGYVILKFRRSKTSVLQKNILCTHGGILGGRKRGGKVNNLEDTLSSFEFDIVMAGHSHDAWTSKRYRISPNSKGVLSHDKKLFINGGSFLNTYNLNDVNDDWTSRKMFSPGIPNMMRVDFYLKEKNRKNYIDVHVRE